MYCLVDGTFARAIYSLHLIHRTCELLLVACATTRCDAKYCSCLEMPFFFRIVTLLPSSVEWLNKCHPSESGVLDEMEWNCEGTFVMNGVSSWFRVCNFFLSKVRAILNVRVVSLLLCLCYFVHYRSLSSRGWCESALFFFLFVCVIVLCAGSFRRRSLPKWNVLLVISIHLYCVSFL